MDKLKETADFLDKQIKKANKVMTDITKSRNYELLCEILGLCIETKQGFKFNIYANRSYILIFWEDDNLNDMGCDYREYDFTFDDPSYELEKAKQQLLNFINK